MNAPLLPALPGYDDPQLIAHGTTALVFRAIQTNLNRPVAIKVITVDTGSVPVNAARELATTVALSSQPHIVSIIDTGTTEDDRPYIVMEYCEGGSYAQILRQRGPLPVDEVLEVGIKIGEALHAAHQVGIVHRDVKPSNILRSRFGPALTDFGIARAPDELGSTLTREMMTPHHASPEALLHQAQSGPSDIYSLASTLWTLLVGHPPFVDPAQPMTDMYLFRDRVLHDPLPAMSREDVPAWLVGELGKAMSKLPSQRHGTAFEFAEALRRGALGLTPTPDRPTPGPVISGTQVHIPGVPALAWPEARPVPPPPPPAPPPTPAPPTPAPPTDRPPPRPPLVPSPPSPVAPVETTPGYARPPAPAALGGPAASLFPPPPAEREPEPELAWFDAPPVYRPPVDATRAPADAPPIGGPTTVGDPPEPTPAPPAAAPLGRPGTPGPARLDHPTLPGPRPRTGGSGVPGGHALARPEPARPPVDEGGWLGAPELAEPRWAEPEAVPEPFHATRRFGDREVIAPSGGRRGGLLAVLVGVAVIAVASASLLLLRSHGASDELPPPVAGGSTTLITGQTSGMPTDVKISEDRGTSVTLTWTDPTAGTVSFVIVQKGSTGDSPVTRTTPPGTKTVTFTNLDVAKNYCFTVGAVYTVSNVAVAPDVCTHR